MKNGFFIISLHGNKVIYNKSEIICDKLIFILNLRMNIYPEDVENIIGDDTSFIFSQSFKHSSQDVLDEVDGDPWWVVYTEEHYYYQIYYREMEDIFFAILTITTVETDNRLHDIRQKTYYIDNIRDILNNNVVNIIGIGNDIYVYNNHKDGISKCLEEYEKSKEDIKNYFNDNIYYELMEKSLHPDRLEWIF
jgi:hypothetical protein